MTKKELRKISLQYRTLSSQIRLSLTLLQGLHLYTIISKTVIMKNMILMILLVI